MENIFNFLKNRELDELYASISLRAFAISLIGIFIPLFLLKSGFTLREVFLYFLIFNLLRVFFSIAAGRFAASHGFKHSILVSIPFLILFFIMLYLNPKTMFELSLIALLGSFANSFFWVGYHMDFAHFSISNKRNKEIGIANTFILLLKSSGPLVGGLIISYFSFHILFALAIFLLSISIFPLLLTKEVYEPVNYSLKKLFRDINPRKFVASMAKGINASVMLVLWPIYIFFFILNKNYIILGGATTAATIFTLLSLILMSNIKDKYSKSQLLLSSLFMGLMHLIRLAIKTVLGVFIFNSVFRVLNLAQGLSFDLRSYEKAVKHGYAETIVLREMNICLGKAIFFGLLCFISIKSGFILAAFITPLIALF